MKTYLCLVIFVLTISFMVTSVCANEQMKIQSDTVADSDGPVHLINISSSIKNSTYMYDLLIPTPYQKQNLMDRIDYYVVGNADFKNKLKLYLNNIWSKYPVQFTDVIEGGDVVTYITFAPEAYQASCTETGRMSVESSSLKAGQPEGNFLSDKELESEIAAYVRDNSRTIVANENMITRTGVMNSVDIPGEPKLCVRETWLLYLVDHAMWTPFENSTSTTRKPRWDEDTHAMFIDHAMQRFSISSTYIAVAKTAAPDPDNWPKGDVPCLHWPWPLNCQIVKDFVDLVVKHWDHFYDPNVLNQGWGAGGAPDAAKKYADIARDLKDTDTEKYKNLGYASHFLTDVGNPEHTGKIGEQREKPAMHDYYEGWVWTERYNLEPDMSAETTYSSLTSPEQMVRENAAVSHVYLDTVYDGIAFETNPSEWTKNATLKNQITTITKRVFRNTAYHTRSLVANVMKIPDGREAGITMEGAEHE